MGFAPKRIKRRRHHRNLATRAKVALAGVAPLIHAGALSTGSKKGYIRRTYAIRVRNKHEVQYKWLDEHTNEGRIWVFEGRLRPNGEHGLVYAFTWAAVYNIAARSHGIQ